LASIKWFSVSKRKVIQDTFDSGIAAWEIVTGSPNINEQFGNPAPCLDLHLESGLKTNCFLCLLPIDTPQKGIIECDVYLEPGSLFNIVFRADPKSEKWYMARLETRNGVQDGFLKDNGLGWFEYKMSNGNTSPKIWHQMKIEIDGPRAKLYRDGKLLAEMEDSDFQSGKIGVFNEVGNVYVDNFSVAKL
jgi:hypothetical protein